MEQTKTLSAGAALVAPVEKIKKSKPRKAVRNLSIKIGRYQIELVIWRFRKTIKIVVVGDQK